MKRSAKNFIFKLSLVSSFILGASNMAWAKKCWCGQTREDVETSDSTDCSSSSFINSCGGFPDRIEPKQFTSIPSNEAEPELKNEGLKEIVPVDVQQARNDFQKALDAYNKDPSQKNAKALNRAKKNKSEAEKKSGSQSDQKVAHKGSGSSDEMNKDQEGGNYCGKYGGLNCENTNIINKSIDMGNQMADKIGSAVMQNKGSTENSALLQQGINATTKAFNDSKEKLLRENAKQNTIVGSINTAGALYQGVRAGQHLASAAKLKTQQQALLTSLESQYNTANAACNSGQSEADCKNAEDLAKQIQLTKVNGSRAIAAQKDQATVSTAAALVTSGQAAMHYMNASASKKLADQMNTPQGGNNTPYVYNMNTGNSQDEGNNNGTTPEAEAVVTNDPAATGALDGGIKDFNPNIGENGTLGPAPGEFKPGAQAAGGGGGSSGGGNAGGTSADRGAGGDGKQETAQAKGQGGGMYSSGDGGVKFSRNGGSGGVGVGMDGSFADLLKKFLPGEEKKEEQANLDLDQSDRSPASDQAAVIGRNKNIFEEIHKRYQKKSKDGAVEFSDKG